MSIAIKVEIDGKIVDLPVLNKIKVIVEGLESFAGESVQLHYGITHEGVMTDFCGTVEGKLETIDSEWRIHENVIAQLEPDEDGDDD